MFILGLVILILGGGAALYGNSLNQSFSVQFYSVFENGTLNPGNVWLTVGIIAAVLGLLAMVFAVIKKKYFTF